MTSVAEQRARAKSLRTAVPRASHGVWTSPERDPVALIAEQNRGRLSELVPVRVGRMLQSPFTYYRGTAGAMAHDLAAGPSTGVHVVACGDAHLSNFGLFASPERRLLFDLNDFDEAGEAPWEWDVKRLAASVYLGGRDAGMSETDCLAATRRAVRAYRRSLAEFAELSVLERYYLRVEAGDLTEQLRGRDRALLRKKTDKARSRTSEQVLAKLVVRRDDGAARIVDQPPVTQHVDHATPEALTALTEQYRGRLREDLALVLSQFTLVDYVLRVVGVGSVGTRCYLLLFEGPTGEPLVLQAKEALPSVLHTYGGMPDLMSGGGPAADDHSQGRRVVATQRILQAQSDPFLGWVTAQAGERAGLRRVELYWRQFRDMKGSIDLAQLDHAQLASYGSLCGRLLARAHIQSPGGVLARWYLGGSESFDEAVASWARQYADVCEADFEALGAAVKAGLLPAERGV